MTEHDAAAKEAEFLKAIHEMSPASLRDFAALLEAEHANFKVPSAALQMAAAARRLAARLAAVEDGA